MKKPLYNLVGLGLFTLMVVYYFAVKPELQNSEILGWALIIASWFMFVDKD